MRITGKPEHALDEQGITEDQISQARHQAMDYLIKQQRPDGHWCFELEADCTIPAEYILMMHFVDEIDAAIQHKLAAYLKAKQNVSGGWPLYEGGPDDISCSVKSYYALKLAGESIDSEPMSKAKQAILSMGGAAKSNVFTRIALAQFQQVPWRAVPYMPIELMFAPRWFVFHLSKVSYWSRTVMVPLLLLCSEKIQAVNPTKVDIQELFITPPDKERHYFPVRSRLNRLFLGLSHFGRAMNWVFPKWLHRKACEKALDWTVERLNGEHGLGAIFPAMVNAFEALKYYGREQDKPHVETARAALKRLIIERADEAYVQPCVSPIWDTALAVCALNANDASHPSISHGIDWLKGHQILDEPGDWQYFRPKLQGGGWAFQYQNAHYPDLDDSALIVWLMAKTKDKSHHQMSMLRGAQWLAGMQSSNGGFASFEIDNNSPYLNEIPFADHGALLDPPTVDVSARCAMAFAALDESMYQTSIIDCVNYLLDEQESNGSWFGRWGTNYVYGTWSVLMALKEIGFKANHPSVHAGLAWLKQVQNSDGGWGEDNGSYFDPPIGQVPSPSTSFQTAWALIALLTYDQHECEHVKRGIQYLVNTQRHGTWEEPQFTAPGFPRVFYLKYHGYSHYFPLWALGLYQKEGS